jgi:hypothetical protein
MYMYVIILLHVTTVVPRVSTHRSLSIIMHKLKHNLRISARTHGHLTIAYICMEATILTPLEMWCVHGYLLNYLRVGACLALDIHPPWYGNLQYSLQV